MQTEGFQITGSENHVTLAFFLPRLAKDIPVLHKLQRTQHNFCYLIEFSPYPNCTLSFFNVGCFKESLCFDKRDDYVLGIKG